MPSLKLASLLPSIPNPINAPKKLTLMRRTLPSPATSPSAASAPIFLSSTTKIHHHWLLLAPSREIPMCARLHVAPHVKRIKNHATVRNNNKNKRDIYYDYYFLETSPFSSESGRGKFAARFISPPSNQISSSSSSETGVAAGLASSDTMGCTENNGVVGPPCPSSLSSRGEKGEAKLLTLPTILTLGRVAAIPVFISTYYVNSWWGTTATTCIFIAAAVTDWLDGYIARKMRLGTAFGAFLDPVADKLMVAATLVLLCSRPSEAAMFRDMPWLLPVPAILIIGREITMSAVREWAASQSSKLSEAVAVNNIGKWKTAMQMIALTILLSSRDSSNGVLASFGVVFLYVSSGLAVWSLVVYGRKIWKVLLR